MCEKCAEVDDQISRLRQIAGLILDRSVLSGIELLIEQCEAKKRELQCEQKAA
jgi:hypothetical protein